MSFLDEYVPPALTATAAKLQRYYLDLFAGPGINVDRSTHEEFPGSTIRVLPTRSSTDSRVYFTHAVTVNLDPDEDAALRTRVERLFESGDCPMPRGHVRHILDDANRALPTILRDIDRRAYVLAFADIENPSQWPWSTVQALRNQGHDSLDLYMLFPLAMGINRLIPWQSEEQSTALTRFFGTEDWRPIVARRLTKAFAPAMRRELLDLYIVQLRKLGWVHTVVARDIRRTGRQALYKMIAASAHEAGGRIATWSAGKADQKHQLGLGF